MDGESGSEIVRKGRRGGVIARGSEIVRKGMERNEEGV